MKWASGISLSGLAVCLIALACEPSGLPGQIAGSAEQPKAADDAFTIFLTGNVMSTLQPCGCSSGQLGGLDRRGAVLAAVPPERRLVIDTGNLLAGDGVQDMIKLGIIWQAMTILGYDVVNLTPADRAALANLGLADGGPFSLISSQTSPGIKDSYSRQSEIAGRPLTVTVASAKAESIDVKNLSSLFGRRAGLALNILIVDDASERMLNQLEKTDFLDVVVCPTAADEPRILRKNLRPLFVTVGRLGKYAARLTATPASGDRLSLQFDRIPVDENLPQDEELMQLYKDYQFMVKEEQLLERHPRVPLPNGLSYMGNETCRSCHEYEYDMWSRNPHARAYETLVKVGSQHDPECIKCHVVGFGYESGFISEASRKSLRNVGCEVCHGPASAHIKAVTTGLGDNGLGEPKAKCVDCHNPDHSPRYQGREAKFLQKIKHWREPKAPGDVK